MKKQNQHGEDRTTALLRIASYLSRPQKFMAIADARAEMRRTLQLASNGSVVLTSHGEPEAAVVPFTMLEDMRQALLHLLVAEMQISFSRTQELVRREGIHTSASNQRPSQSVMEDSVEAEKLVGQVLRKARRAAKSNRRMSRG